MATEAPPREPSDTLDEKQLLRVLMAIKKDEFSIRMSVDQTGTAGKIADTMNEIIDLNERMTTEFERVSKVVGREGKISQRAEIGATGGSWTSCVNAVNTLITNLVQPTTEV